MKVLLFNGSNKTNGCTFTALLGATKDMLDGMVNSTLIMDGGYKVMNKDDIRAVLTSSF